MALAYVLHNEPTLCSMLLRCFSIPFRLEVYLLESSCRYLVEEEHDGIHIGHRCTSRNTRSRQGSAAYLIFNN